MKVNMKITMKNHFNIKKKKKKILRENYQIKCFIEANKLN